MFEGLLNRAQRSVDTLVTKYVARVAVAVPFVIALGFGTAAANVKLTEIYGSMVAHSLVALAFAAIGCVAAAVIALSPVGNPISDTATEQTAAEPLVAAQASKETSPSIDPELLLTVVGALGPAAVPAISRVVMRNLPLLLAMVLLAYLLFSQRSDASDAAAPDFPGPAS